MNKFRMSLASAPGLALPIPCNFCLTPNPIKASNKHIEASFMDDFAAREK